MRDFLQKKPKFKILEYSNSAAGVSSVEGVVAASEIVLVSCHALCLVMGRTQQTALKIIIEKRKRLWTEECISFSKGTGERGQGKGDKCTLVTALPDCNLSDWDDTLLGSLADSRHLAMHIVCVCNGC